MHIRDQPEQAERLCLYKKSKNGQVRWCITVVPATLETEVGGWLEPQEVEAAVSLDHATALQPG